MSKRNIYIGIALLVFFTTFAVIAVHRHTRWQVHSFTPVHAGSESKELESPSTPQQTASEASLQEEEHTKFGYVLALSYEGQQSTGIRSLVSQQCIVGSLHLPMYVVEPFIPESTFEGFQRPLQDYMTNHIPSMKDYFDIDQYNAASEDKGWAKLAPWEDFVKNIPQKVIFVSLNVIGKCSCMPRAELHKPTLPIKVTWSANATEPCYHRSLKPIENLPNREKLCIVRLVNANAEPYIDLSDGEFEVLFGQWKPDEVTLVFSRSCPSTYVKKTALTRACNISCEKELNNLLYPSPKLLKHVERYEMTFLRERSNFKVAVMMRSEIMSPRTCIKEVIRFVRQNFTTDAMFVTADVGRYGSNSVSNNNIDWVQSVKDAVVTILNNTLTFEEWEDSFTDVTEGMTNGGYIATLQRAIASRADCLVLAGGGNFLKMALYQYLNNHPKQADQCVHILCVPKGSGFEDQYYSILRAGDK